MTGAQGGNRHSREQGVWQVGAQAGLGLNTGPPSPSPQPPFPAEHRQPCQQPGAGVTERRLCDAQCEVWGEASAQWTLARVARHCDLA